MMTKRRKNRYNLKLIGGTIITTLILSEGVSLSLKKSSEASSMVVKKNIISNCELNKETKITSESIINTIDDTTSEKNQVLDNFYLCDSLDKILKRQSELENLDLTDNDKIYKDCSLSAPLQHFIYEQSIMNEVPFDFLMSIIYVETRGNFNSSGQVAYNGEGNYDLGLTQQNTVSSLPNFEVNYNIGYDDSFNLLKDNDYANVCSAFLGIKEIKKQYPEFDEYEYAGCYNGWLNWRNYSTSCEYVSMFEDVYNNVFTEHHSIEKSKTQSNSHLK